MPDHMVGVTAAIKCLGPLLWSSCKGVTAIAAALDAAGLGEDAVAVQQQVTKLITKTKQTCDSYNKLRSLAAVLERAEGVISPVFYLQDYKETGTPQCTHGTCMCGEYPK